jgi:hypothetical protein
MRKTSEAAGESSCGCICGPVNKQVKCARRDQALYATVSVSQYVVVVMYVCVCVCVYVYTYI